MARKPRGKFPGPKQRSAAQREWNVALGLASMMWEAATDAQRLAWNTEGKSRRTSGQRLFTGINARRIRDGQAPLMDPPPRQGYSGRLVLRRFFITNRRGRLRLKVEISAAPGVRITVWGSRPCNRGVSRRPKCPRLGDLPASKGKVRDFTKLYFRKHAEYLRSHGVQLVGKRIFICTRVELDDSPGLWEGADAVVPEPESRSQRANTG